jgi:hypothetical protein
MPDGRKYAFYELAQWQPRLPSCKEADVLRRLRDAIQNGEKAMANWPDIDESISFNWKGEIVAL